MVPEQHADETISPSLSTPSPFPLPPSFPAAATRSNAQVNGDQLRPPEAYFLSLQRLAPTAVPSRRRRHGPLRSAFPVTFPAFQLLAQYRSRLRNYAVAVVAGDPSQPPVDGDGDVLTASSTPELVKGEFPCRRALPDDEAAGRTHRKWFDRLGGGWVVDGGGEPHRRWIHRAAEGLKKIESGGPVVYVILLLFMSAISSQDFSAAPSTAASAKINLPAYKKHTEKVKKR